jgi:hypothetical protein
MSTPAPPASPAGAVRARRPGVGPLALAAVTAVVVIAVCLVWMAGESHYRSCIAQANAKFPAVPVSAFNGRATGPLRVSFVDERTKAVGDCSRFF